MNCKSNNQKGGAVLITGAVIMGNTDSPDEYKTHVRENKRPQIRAQIGYIHGGRYYDESMEQYR